MELSIIIWNARHEETEKPVKLSSSLRSLRSPRIAPAVYGGIPVAAKGAKTSLAIGRGYNAATMSDRCSGPRGANPGTPFAAAVAWMMMRRTA